MLNSAQTSYLIGKFNEKYPREITSKNPFMAIEAIGYLKAIKEATDIYEAKTTITTLINILCTSSTFQLLYAMEVKPNDKL